MTASAPAFGDVPLARFLDSLGAGGPYPGSGSAGAVTLALAAGCAVKAATISLKHAPGDTALETARARFAAIGHCALAGAQADAEHFGKLIAALQLPHELAGRHETIVDEAARTVDAGRWLIALAEELDRALAAVEDRLHASMAGDVFAARALLEANRRIQTNNVEANALIG